MYKVGQRVRVTNVTSTPWWNFNLDDKERFLNKIFKITADLGTIPASGDHGWRLDTPHGVVHFSESQFRALKKKGELKAAKIPVVTLKDEVNWLNKVKKNFTDAGRVYSPEDEPSASRYGLITRAINRAAEDVSNDTVRVVLGTPPRQPTFVPPQRAVDWTNDQIQDDMPEETNDEEVERILTGDYEREEGN